MTKAEKIVHELKVLRIRAKKDQNRANENATLPANYLELVGFYKGITAATRRAEQILKSAAK